MTATNQQPVAEICSASHDDAQFGERAIKPLCDISGFEYGTPLYAGAAPAAVAPQGEEWRRPTTYLKRFGDAIALLCHGRRPEDQVLSSWLDGTSDVLQQFAVDNGPAWAQGIGLIDAATIAADQPTEGVAHEMRADRTPALEAPAHQCCNSWFLALPEGRQAVLRENQWMLADAAYQAGRESQPALEAPAVPERQVLTDAQITHLQETRVGEPSPSRPIDASDWTNFARAIEAAVLATLAKCDPAWRQGQRELLQYVARRACDPALPVDVVRAAHAAMPDELAARLRKAAATLAVRHSSYSNISIAWPDEKLLKSAEGRYHQALADLDALISAIPTETKQTADRDQLDSLARKKLGALLNAFGEAQWQAGRGVPCPSIEDAFEAVISAAVALLAAAPQAPAAPSAVATQVVESLLQLARIVNTAVEDWGESFEDGSMEVKFHKDEADKLEEILEFFDSLPDAPPEEGVILSGPSRAARVLRAMAAPAAPVVDAGDQVLGEWPRVSGVGRDAESPRTLLLYLQTEASDDELRAIHDALLDGGALATHALSELMHIGYRVEGGKLVPPENLSVRASEFFGVTAVAAKATAVHSDDVAVDRFAVEMKAKLAAARAKGRGGWETCPPEVLSRMLREHADKGDPRDVANFCMFLWSLGQPISVAAPAAPAVDAAELGEWVATLEVDSEGGLDYETVPPCTLPPGCYRLYRAAQTKEGGDQ